MSTDRPSITFRCTPDRKNRFYRKCKRNNEVPSDVIRRMMDDYIRGNIAYGVTTTTK